MRVTLKDIARRANVNFTLVSKYINKTPGVSMRPETRERIQKAIEELNYHPIAAARALRYGKSNTLGLIVGNLTNEYYAHYADVAISEAEKLGYRLLISVCRGDSSEKEIQNLDANQVDGIVCPNSFTPAKSACPLLTERLYTEESLSDAAKELAHYLRLRRCRSLAVLSSNALWEKVFRSATGPKIEISHFSLDSTAEKRLKMLRTVCKKRPDAIFSTGWLTVNQLSDLLDQDYPEYNPVIFCRANCKGPFLKNPRIRGVIMTSTRFSIQETFASLENIIRTGKKVKRPEPIPGKFILHSDPEYGELAGDVFGLT